MIPLKDNIPAQRLSVVNTALIVLNFGVFLYIFVGSGPEASIFHHYSLIPARVTGRAVAAHLSFIERLIPFITHMFLHGGWLHVLGNMWSLWIFGDNVEDRLGHLRYFVFYLLCGVGAACMHVLLNLDSRIPTVGASGAVAGVMGAYLVLYPRARVLTLMPLFVFFPIVEIPAFFFLGLWFLMQFVNAFFGFLGGAQALAGIAWWAHVGGFLTGIVLLGLMGGRARRSH
jgi:membrane associated rhomboid family serine protease